jgi:uncharacterized protein (TIGR03437 family)
MAARFSSACAWLAIALASVGGPLAGQDPCTVSQLTKSALQGLKVYAPDRRRFLINMPDSAGTPQIYISQDGSSNLVCITCVQRLNGPKPERFKMQPHWHPSGNWIFLAVERDDYTPPPFATKDYIDGQLQNGIWTNMWAVSPDGMAWFRLTDFKSGVPGVADGFTGPAFTPDGTKAVWSQIMDGNIFVYYPFGRWELTQADFDTPNGIPTFSNLRNITPPGMNWNEPGNFHPDNETLLFTGSNQADAEGMDLYTLNIRTAKLVDLTNSPTVWDEHGVFSPDGEKIIFMSAYPYRSDPSSSQILTIKTEFMLMNKDGSNLTQLTHFRQPGYPEYSSAGGIASTAEWNPNGGTVYLSRLFFPAYEYWDLNFQGDCGDNTLISLVGNAFGDTPVIAPNTWVEIKGASLAPVGDRRIWQGPDFANNRLPTQMDGVSVTVNGKNAYLYYISPTQVNILTPPDPLPTFPQVQLTNNGVTSNLVFVEAQPLSLSFFEFVSSGGFHYVYGRHVSNNGIIGPPTLFPGLTSTPVKPGEAIYIAATGFGPTDVQVSSGALTQLGNLPQPFPVVKIGGIPAQVSFAGLVSVGTYQINLVVPPGVPDGDLPLTATYKGFSIQPNLLITVQH